MRELPPQQRGRMAQIRQSAVRNHLLARLPPDEFVLLAGSLRPLDLTLKQVLHTPDRSIELVHFPESGMVSLVIPLEGGQLMEVGIVGREGMVGLPVVLGAESGSVEAMVQLPGAALSLPAAVLVEALGRGPALNALLLRYAQAFHVQVAQTAACNGRHPVEERLARWLLMTHDRAGVDTFPMTQEFIAMMLGVRRAGVSVAAGLLQRTGVITYKHGYIAVLDRAGLEGTSCECYGAVRGHFERLLAIPAGE
jgi:CRP-like cAMP-binding protein